MAIYFYYLALFFLIYIIFSLKSPDRTISHGPVIYICIRKRIIELFLPNWRKSLKECKNIKYNSVF